MRALLTLGAWLLLAPAHVAVRTYNLDADTSTRYPTERTITSPPTALKSATFNLDPWTFAGGGNEFSTASVQTSLLPIGLGTVRAHLALGGRLISVPALPLAGMAGLAAGLMYLGAQMLRRKRD